PPVRRGAGPHGRVHAGLRRRSLVREGARRAGAGGRDPHRARGRAGHRAQGRHELPGRRRRRGAPHAHGQRGQAVHRRLSPAMSSPSAGQRPNPWLVEWLRTFTATPNRKRCLVVGCGAGDDAEALASAGYTVTACDRSAEAIQTCRRRFPRSGVDYAVADILDPPPSWGEGFDLVFDASTLDTVAPAL